MSVDPELVSSSDFHPFRWEDAENPHEALRAVRRGDGVFW